VLDKTIITKPVNDIVDMDIEKFFDSIKLRWLVKGLKQRIKNASLLCPIVRFLKAGIYRIR